MNVPNVFPEVASPRRRLSFQEKLKWTSLTLIVYFVLGMIPLYGLSPEAIDYFASLRTVIGGQFSSIITLGIGPIVTAGIILQLMVGVELLPFDLTKPEDKQNFQNLQTILTYVVTLFEAFMFVFTGGLPARTPTLGLQLLLVLQLCAGTILIMLLDQVSQKWGFISGISLFIAAGVSKQIFVAALNPLASPANPDIPSGMIPAAFYYIAQGNAQSAFAVLIPVIFTVVVFLIAVYAQAIQVEIPLSYGNVRGFGTRWPLNLFYTGNIPVILVAALLANFQIWGVMAQNAGFPILGTFPEGQNAAATSGLMYFLTAPRTLTVTFFSAPGQFISGLISNINSFFVGESIYNLSYLSQILKAICYTLFMMLGSVLFSIFWVKTANQTPREVARQIQSSGMRIKGFRSDPRILEKILQRYIPYLTVLGGLSVGALAAFADFTNALGGGTGILLTVMIIYRLYQTVMKEHMVDMYPALKNFVEA